MVCANRAKTTLLIQVQFIQIQSFKIFIVSIPSIVVRDPRVYFLNIGGGS
jgi:hypothetical protein